MYVIIALADGTTKLYRDIRNPSFEPEVDLTLSSLPVDEFSVEIVTNDEFKIDGSAALYDDLDQKWAAYYVKDVKRVGGGVQRVTAQSAIGLMDRWTMGGGMFENVTVQDFVGYLFSSTPESGWLYSLPYTIDNSIKNNTVSGFCPSQTARERLQWLCLAAGCMVVTAFRDSMAIVPHPIPRDPSPTLIPMGKTFWKPEIDTRSRVASLRVTGYEDFTTTEPEQEDQRNWASIGKDTLGREWYALPYEMSFENEDRPQEPGSEPSIDGVTLLGGDDTLSVLSALAPAYFTRQEVTADVINNRQYAPGERVTVYLDEKTLVCGFIQSASFAFGKQARSTLKLLGAEPVQAAGLTILYMWGDIQIGRQDWLLPYGYAYAFDTAYIDMTMNSHRYVFRPLVTQVTGTIGVEDTTVTVDCVPALEYHDGVLDVIAVDDITTITETIDSASVIIGVIA